MPVRYAGGYGRITSATGNARLMELRITGARRLAMYAGRAMTGLVAVVVRANNVTLASFLRRVVVKNIAGAARLVGSGETPA